jgi:microcystin-dependent protein
MGFLTPDSIPADTICRTLFIPNNDEFIANVTGALQTLIFPESWTPQGTLTPEQSAAALVDMFDQFCFNQGTCRVISEIICLATTTSPDARWLPCDGSSLLRADYPDLFTVIGTTYGAADGSHFNIPDLGDRIVLGNGSLHTLGDSFGEEEHTLIIDEMPLHTHADTGHLHSEITALANVTTIGAGAPQPTAIPGVGLTGSASANITNAGNDQPHNNMQPCTVLAYFIVALS